MGREMKDPKKRYFLLFLWRKAEFRKKKKKVFASS